MVEAVVEDETGLLNLVFFNQPWQERQLAVGTEVALYGKLDIFRGQAPAREPDRRRARPRGRGEDRRHHADLPAVREGRRLDVGDPEGGRGDARLRRATSRTRSRDDLRAELKHLPERTWSYRNVHQPEVAKDCKEAQRRLRFDEFLRIQIPLVLRKRTIEAERGGIEHQVDGELLTRFLELAAVRADRGPARTRST